jgi:predicted nucleotidyltransferase
MNTLGIAIYGSVAKNEDREYSDLELFVVTTRKLKTDCQRYVYKNCAIEITYIPERVMLGKAREVTPNWPISADFYRNYSVLYEKDGWFEKLRRAVKECDGKAFERAIQQTLVWLHELLGKIKNAYRHGDDELFFYLCSLFGWESMIMLGLINRQYYRSERTAFTTVLGFSLIPHRYKYLLKTVCHFDVTDRRIIYRAALEMYRGLSECARSQGLSAEDSRLLT